MDVQNLSLEAEDPHLGCNELVYEHDDKNVEFKKDVGWHENLG